MRHDVGSLPAVRVNVSPTRSTVCYRSVTTSDSSNSSPGGDRAAIHPGYDLPISKPLCVKGMFLGAFECPAGVVSRLVVALVSGPGSD